MRAGPTAAVNPYEVAVVGGGPAGLSAAMAAGRMNRRTVCFETATPRTAHAPRYYNYLGFPEGISGVELLQRGREQARRWGTHLHDLAVERIERSPGPEGELFLLRTAAGDFHAQGLIFATGILDRQPGCGNLYGEAGVHYCVVCDGYETRGQIVAVLGRGRRAFGMLRALRDFTSDLHLLTDGQPPELDAGERAELEEWGVRVLADALESHTCSEEGVRFRGSGGREVLFPHVFVALGVTPNTALAASIGCELDEQGFIVTDSRQATGVPFVYAAGDCDGGHKQVTQAMAEGERAALELARSLREAVGPALGSMQSNEAGVEERDAPETPGAAVRTGD
ncbi:MAG: NAD(P)/FAD-dependent oxidoreductase [Gemmatimonadota bacterium]